MASKVMEEFKQDEEINEYYKELPMELCSLNDNEIKVEKKTKREKRAKNWLLRRSVMLSKRKIKNKERRSHRQEQRKLIRPIPSEADIKSDVVLDLSYSHLMSPKDKTRCWSQVVRCYSSNRRTDNPFRMHVSSFKDDIEEFAKKNEGYAKWNVKFHENHYAEMFDIDKIVYLTADSSNVLHQLEDGKVYIIGALVDHNSHKGVTYSGAIELGVHHARLPIRENMPNFIKNILTINQVFDVLLEVNGGTDWTTALSKMIPLRIKRAHEKNVIVPQLLAIERQESIKVQAKDMQSGEEIKKNISGEITGKVNQGSEGSTEEQHFEGRTVAMDDEEQKGAALGLEGTFPRQEKEAVEQDWTAIGRKAVGLGTEEALQVQKATRIQIGEILSDREATLEQDATAHGEKDENLDKKVLGESDAVDRQECSTTQLEEAAKEHKQETSSAQEQKNQGQVESKAMDKCVCF